MHDKDEKQVLQQKIILQTHRKYKLRWVCHPYTVLGSLYRYSKHGGLRNFRLLLSQTILLLYRIQVLSVHQMCRVRSQKMTVDIGEYHLQQIYIQHRRENRQYLSRERLLSFPLMMTASEATTITGKLRETEDIQSLLNLVICWMLYLPARAVSSHCLLTYCCITDKYKAQLKSGKKTKFYFIRH